MKTVQATRTVPMVSTVHRKYIMVYMTLHMIVSHAVTDTCTSD